ncbi:MAG TPA: hypothetical protein VHQ90_23580 [Thermoanaerobaculia bacterium]|nr:hypothetical protein [Thermoanaerobaculia bacterium]
MKRFDYIGLAMALLAAGLLSSSPAAHACSICRCGDATFNALGTNVYSAVNPFRVSLDWERFDKTQGAIAAGGREAVVENRLTAGLSYTFADRVIAVARVPLSSHHLTSQDLETSRTTTARSLADPELYVLARLWASNFAPGLGRRAWVSVLGGVKTSWGNNDVTRNGVRLDEHLQPGTGSTDYFTGLSGLYLLDSRSSLFSSVQVRYPGANHFGYRYGNIKLANFGYEHKLGTQLDGVIDLNYRNAAKDRVDPDTGLDADTGGTMLYLSPKLSVDVGRGVVARLAVQVPVVSRLNGNQKERVVANAGFTALFR